MTTMTMTMGVVVPLLPVLLLASSSVLLDVVTLRHEPVLDRCRCQVAMWLAVAVAGVPTMQWMADGPDDNACGSFGSAVVLAWAHAVLCSNLIAVLAGSVPRRRRQRTVQDLARPLPASSWLAMMAAVVHAGPVAGGTADDDVAVVGPSLAVFGGSFVGACLLRWHVRRQRTLARDLRGMPAALGGGGGGATLPPNGTCCWTVLGRFCGTAPHYDYDGERTATTSSHDALGGGPDEGLWHTWDRTQTLRWISHQLVAGPPPPGFAVGTLADDDTERSEEVDLILAILEPHRIDGEALEGLEDVTHLLALRVPYGPAFRLSRAVSRLVILTGRRSRPYGAATTATDDDDNGASSWLDRHDQEYNRPGPAPPTDNPRRAAKQLDPTPPGPGWHHAFHPPHVTEEQQQRLSGVFRDRFGLELPKLATARDDDVVSDAEKSPDSSDWTGGSVLHPLTTPDQVGNGGAGQRPPVAGIGSSGGIRARPREPPAPYHRGCPPAAGPPLLGEAPADAPSLSPSLLGQLPQHIQDIAQRRPDLVRDLMRRRRREGGDGAAPSSSLRPRSGEGDEPSEGGEGGSDSGGDDDDRGDETTSLIQQEAMEFPVRYKSIDKSMQ